MRSLDETIGALSEKLLALDPGPLSELRRMEPGDPGTPSFWRIAVGLDLPRSSLHIWMQIVKIMAVLTPKGNRGASVRLNDPAHALGSALCDGGTAAWPPPGNKPAPRLSELRLARFLCTPTAQRGDSLERIARMLAGSRDPGRGIRCAEIACLLLHHDEKTLHDVAYAYYARLDHAASHLNEEGTH